MGKIDELQKLFKCGLATGCRQPTIQDLEEIRTGLQQGIEPLNAERLGENACVQAMFATMLEHHSPTLTELVYFFRHPAIYGVAMKVHAARNEETMKRLDWLTEVLSGAAMEYGEFVVVPVDSLIYGSFPGAQSSEMLVGALTTEVYTLRVECPNISDAHRPKVIQLVWKDTYDGIVPGKSAVLVAKTPSGMPVEVPLGSIYPDSRSDFKKEVLGGETVWVLRKNVDIVHLVNTILEDATSMTGNTVDAVILLRA